METFTGISQLLGNLCHGSVWSYAVLWKLQHTTQTIVGITASSEKHKWISLWELNSRLLLEYPGELQLQAAAGIKTIVLVPVLALGVVQLGSFYELSEDLKMVAQIKDLFLSSQYTLEMQSFFAPQTNSDIALERPMIQKYSASLARATELIDPSYFQPVVMQDWINLNCDEMAGEEFLPQLMVQPNDSLPQVGLGADSSEQIIWDEMCKELLSDNTGSALVGDQSTLSHRDEEIETIQVIGNCLAPDDPFMLNNDNYGYDLNHIEEPCLGFGEEFDVVMNSITDGLFLNYPGEEIQLSSPAEFQGSACIAKQSEVNELTNPSSIFQVQVPKPVEEPAAIIKDNIADYLPDEMAFESSAYQSPSITQSKDGDRLGSEVSIAGIHRVMPSAFSHTEEGLRSNLMSVQNNSINITSSNEDQKDTTELELRKKSSKQGKRRGCGGPRPRDRQLIQDRTRELRELIPNGSKCSIDELLERAVAHMVFLQSVPLHAEKLNKSRRTKVGTNSNIHGKPLPQNESSLVTKRSNLPLLVENLEQPDQMLIEMQCTDYGLFLDTAQAFKRLKLTILEGALQSTSTEQWAHFVVQVPVGFNRIDILWPLMQLLQFKFCGNPSPYSERY